MEWWLMVLALVVVLAILNTERQAATVRREVARLDRKLNRILEEMNIPFDDYPALSERVKEIARDPMRKIEAIKLHREETGSGLAEAKRTIEAFIDSLQR
jgi:ribosomal protein L7/L12